MGEERGVYRVLNITPVRYCPYSSLMHCRAWFVPLYITRTWQVKWNFFQKKFIF